MISKMRDDEAGSRIGIVMNGSPLFTGGADSGESEIRRWMLENDWVEAIVALSTDLFYNTGIQTYVWLLTNRKAAARRGKVQLIDASGERFWQSMRKSLGSKRREIPDEARHEIVRIYADFLNSESMQDDVSKIFDTTDFGYREIRVERPLRLNLQASKDRVSRLHDDKAFLKLGADEREEIEVALLGMSDALFTNRHAEREVKPFVPDAWVDESSCDAHDGEVGRVGYEISFNRYFYRYYPPRGLEEIDAELKLLEAEIAGLLKEVVA